MAPALVMGAVVVFILFFLWVVIANAQTHTFPGNNVFPSTSTTDFNAGATVDFTGATVTGLAAGGGNVSNSGTPTAGQYGKWVTSTTISGVAVGTVRSDLGLVIGTNVQAWDTDLDQWALKAPYAGTLTITTGKTFNVTNTLTLSGTDSSTLNIGAGGTLGTAAYTASTAYQAVDTDLTALAGIAGVRGDVIFYGASGWTRLGVGTSGNQLTTNGAGADPTWAAPGSGGGGTVTSITATSPIVVAPTPLTATGVVSLDKTVDLALTAVQSVVLSNATTNTVTDILTLGHNSSGGAGAINFGTGLLFQAEDSTTDNTSIGEIQAVWTNATHNSNVSKMVFKVLAGGLSLGSQAVLSGAGLFDVTGGFLIGGTAPTGRILQGDGTKYIQSTPTWPTTAGTARKIVVSDGTNLVSSTETWAVPGTTGNLLTSDGTNWTSAAGVTATSTTTFTNKRITPRVSTSATGNTTPTPNADTDDMYVATGMTVNMVFGAPTGTPTDGQKLIVRIKDSGAARTLGFNVAYRFSTDLIAPTTTVISKTMYLGFVWNGVDSKWDCLAQRNNL
jgi:hypothetical protein